MKSLVAAAAFLFLIFSTLQSIAQSRREDIYTDFVLYHKRELLKKDLEVIQRAFSLPIDSNTEYKFESSCRAVSQFMLANDEVEQGFARLFQRYDSLEHNTKRSLLESVYGLYHDRFAGEMQKILDSETDPALFAVAALYTHRLDASDAAANALKIKMVENFPGYDTLDVLVELEKYINNYQHRPVLDAADVAVLFRYQSTVQKKGDLFFPAL